MSSEAHRVKCLVDDKRKPWHQGRVVLHLRRSFQREMAFGVAGAMKRSSAKMCFRPTDSTGC